MDFFSFLPAVGNTAVTVIAFVIALSIIVAIHEYGHYIVGKWCGIHAEVFSLGFGPVLTSRVDRHGTKWQIAAFPFGGYVKFLGDANAASGKDGEAIAGLSDAERRHTMHGAPLWARAATVAAGPVFNFVLSFLIFTTLFLFTGKAVDEVMVGELRNHPVEASGLQSGDKITAIDGQPVENWEDYFELFKALPTPGPYSYDVVREGRSVSVIDSHPFPPIVTAYQPRSAALTAGIEIGDVITGVDGQPISSFEELVDIVQNSEGRELQMEIWRDGTSLTLPMTPRLKDDPQQDGTFKQRYMIGIVGGQLFEPATESVGLLDAAGAGAARIGTIVSLSFSGLYHIASGMISSCNISGPIGIAQSAGVMADHGLLDFISFIAVLSTAVGLLNLFPIPILDGGHLVFHAYEAITGRPPHERAMQLLMSIGLTLLLSLMVFATFNDVLC